MSDRSWEQRVRELAPGHWLVRGSATADRHVVRIQCSRIHGGRWQHTVHTVDAIAAAPEAARWVVESTRREFGESQRADFIAMAKDAIEAHARRFELRRCHACEADMFLEALTELMRRVGDAEQKWSEPVTVPALEGGTE